MSRAIIVCIIMVSCSVALFALASKIKVPKECGANAHKAQCSMAGAGCYDNCERVLSTPTPPPPKICNKNCVPACDCDHGFVFKGNASSGDCIPEEQCWTEQVLDKKCGANAHFSRCSDVATGCYDNCDRVLSGHEHVACLLPCMSACDCNHGFAFKGNSSSGDCIPKQECMQR